MTAPIKFFETSVDEPFRRINVPPTHRFGSDEPDDDRLSIGDRISGDGYACGCRSIRDYDKKIGKKIGQDISDFLAKVIPFYAAFRGLQAGLSKIAAQLPLVGPKLSELIDDADPVKALLRFLGGEVDALLVEGLFRNVPAWVPVLRNSQVAKDFEEQEVQGVLVRSHQRYDGVPYSQWHRWYDWSFLVAPVGPSADVIGGGNRRRTDGGDSQETRLNLDSRRYERHWMPRSANIDFTVQCELDLGVISDPVLFDKGQTRQDEQSRDGAFFNIGPLIRDWGWPMAGQYFWCGGRSVYDCRGATSDDKAVGLHLNQLHPIKALATARFEGFRFKENRDAVPAIQFCFFATNAKESGGNFKFAKFADADYEFVIQLPRGGFGVQSPDPHAIGAIPAFSLNTIDVGRRLLSDVNFKPFETGVHQDGRAQCPDPIITPVMTVPGRAPTHVHVKIPFTTLPTSATSCGMVLTLGWHDPSGILARGMFEVDVRFTELEIREDHETAGNSEFLMNFGANGRWFQRFYEIPSATQDRPFRQPILNAAFTMLMSAEDRVFVACHGAEEDPEGDQFKLPLGDPNLDVPPPDDASKSQWDKFLEDSLKSRKLRLSRTVNIPTGVDRNGNIQRERVDLPFVGPVVDWRVDVDPDLPRLPDDQAKASEVARALFLRAATYQFNGNDPLGLIDQNINDPRQQFGRRRDNVDTPNPHRISDVLRRTQIGVPLDCQHTAYATTRLGRMGTLGFDERPRAFSDDADPREVHDAEIDYILKYTITVRRLGTPPTPPPPPPPPPPPNTDPTIRPESVNVRVVPGPNIVPPSVNVRVVPGPSIVPPSVVVRVVPGPTIVPPSVNVVVVPGPTIAPASVDVRVVQGPSINPASVNVRIRQP